jgi:hypothetical protein
MVDHTILKTEIFLCFLIHFAKLCDRFKFLQIWQPTAVRHGGLKGNRRGQGGR